MKKAFKIPLIILGVVAGLLLMVNFLAGPIAKNYLEKHDQELLGRELSIEKLKVNLFVGKLKIKGLTCYEDDGTTAFVSSDRIETQIKFFALLKHRVCVRHALISGLKVNIEQNHEWFNFNSLREFFASGKSEENTSDYHLIFDDVRIDKSSIRYMDLALGSEFLFRDISLHIPSIDLSDLKTDVGLDFSLSENATLHTDLKLSNNGKYYSINLKLNNLDIEVIEPYLQQYYPVDLTDGFVNLDVEAQGQTNHILDFDLRGDLMLNDISFRDMEGNPLGTIDSVFSEIKRFSLNDKILDFDKLHLCGLKTAYHIKADNTTNFDLVLDSYSHRDSIFLDTISEQVLSDKEEDKSWGISITDLNLAGGQVIFEDQSLSEVFQYQISDICLSSKHFTLDGNNSIQIQAALNKIGKLHLNWQGSLQGKNNQNLTLMLSNVKCSDFSPYAVYWFGFPLEDGTMSVRSQNIISDDNLNGINKLQISMPKIGNKVKHFHPKYEKVPLKLGFYLLTDAHHNVSLDLPVSGRMEDPDFSYGKLLMKAFSNLIVKAATSPFRHLLSDEESVKYIPYNPLQGDFSASEYVMIDNVADALGSQLNMGIILEAKVNYETTIQELCNMQLLRDYYLATHPEVDPLCIDFMTNEAIRSIKLNDKGLCAFANQYSEKKKLHSKKDVASVAYAVYHEKSEKLLMQLMDRRNAILSHYLLEIKGLPHEQVSVTTMDASLLKAFDKDSRYELHVVTYADMEE